MTPTRTQQGETAAAPPLPRRLPFVSVIVPVRNEAAFIRDTLEQLLNQDYPRDRYEVLVADGQSDDATPELVGWMAARNANLRLLDNPGRLSSAGRNRAIRAARGDIVLLVDGHCDLGSRRYLREVAEAFARSGADCLGRPQPLDVAAATPLQRAIAAARASRLGHQPDSYIYAGGEGFVRPQSVAVAYRRSVFDHVGLFDERFDACEDVEFNHRVDRAGLRCFFTPRVSVRYYPRSNLSGLFRQMMRYGRGRVRLLRKHRDTFSVPIFVPAAFVLGVALGPALARLSPWLALAYAGALGLYATLLLLATAACVLRSGDRRIAAWLPLVFLTIHVGAGCGLLQELFAGAVRRRAATEPEQAPVPLERRAA
jgi:cellulose synthase/poly-beta-1,6-N-acetylglucosamine synthase-like glycosyltransferase